MHKIKRYLYFIVFCFISISEINAQCLLDNHSTNPLDHWESCITTPSPNALRGEGHWQLYDLGFIYNLNETHFWNYNVAGNTNQGVKDLSIDYSIDGLTWTEATEFQLSEAPGESSYLGEVGPSLSGISARYILLFVQTTYGDTDCCGLAEFKITVDMGVKINAKVFLEGNFVDANLGMTDNLRQAGFIPSFEPYTYLLQPQINGGGYEFVSSEALSITGDNAIVDWFNNGVERS